ncbi:MAG: metallophosphoesterase [Deltaproteobacteria bacterium]|nr:metallophosphoesterase [Deltaproteobacteria bacterium]
MAPWREHTRGWRIEARSEDLEIAFAPGRTGVPSNRGVGPAEGAHECVFCATPPDDTRVIAWRDLQIRPNRYPYVGPDGAHLLVTTRTHEEQGFDIPRLGSLIDLQHALRAAGRTDRTFFFNGVMGNSQAHWHWQVTDARFPLDRLLEQGKIPLTTVRRTPQISISTYDQGLMKGVLLEGTKAAVQRWTNQLVRGLEDDPESDGRYSLALLPLRGDRTRLIVIPRCAPAFETPAVGTLSYLGYILVQNETVSEEKLRTHLAAAREQVLAPRTLSAVQALGDAPEPPILALRSESPVTHRDARNEKVVIDSHGEFVLPNHLSTGGVKLPRTTVAGRRLRFVVFGDDGHDSPEAKSVSAAVRQIAKNIGAHFGLHTGDIMYPSGMRDPNDPRAKPIVVDRHAGLKKLYLANGNHDWGNHQAAGDPDVWRAVAQGDNNLVMPSRYYLFGYRFGPTTADFFVLDTSVLASDDLQRDWLASALKQSKADWKIVVGHHPLYSYGLHGSQPHMQQLLRGPLQANADLYVGGHEHDLQVLEKDDVVYLVSGASSDTRHSSSGEETVFSAGDTFGFMSVGLEDEKLSIEVHGKHGESLFKSERTRRQP